MKIMAIDHGSKKIGLAVSDETELVAMPLEIIRFRNQEHAIDLIVRIIEKLKIDQLVLGIPSGWNGDSPQTKLVRTFQEELVARTGKTIELWDETYSSKIAEKGARGRKRENSDSEAARIILQEYLDHKRTGV